MNRSDSDPYRGPIRSYKQVADEMRRRGDEAMTVGHVYYYENSAFQKLRKMLAAYEEETR
jgi:hypothetical protein